MNDAITTVRLNGHIPAQNLTLRFVSIVLTGYTQSSIQVDLPFLNSFQVHNCAGDSRLYLPVNSGKTYMPHLAFESEIIPETFQVDLYDSNGVDLSDSVVEEILLGFEYSLASLF